MAEPVLLGTRKRGDDWRFRTIRVRSRATGDPIDLTEDGWTIACNLRPRADRDEDPGIVPVIDETDYANGGVVLTVPKATSATMQPRTWYGDLQVDGPAGRHSSSTFRVEVLRDQTYDG